MSESKKGTECFAFNCKNYRNKITHAQGISFHKFPNKEKFKEQYEIWLDKTGQTVRLRPNAVPSIFDLPKHLQPKPVKERKTVNSTKAKLPLATQECTMPPKLDAPLYLRQPKPVNEMAAIDSTESNLPLATQGCTIPPKLDTPLYLEQEHAYCLPKEDELKRKYIALREEADRLRED